MKSEDTIFDENIKGKNEDTLYEPQNMKTSEKPNVETSISTSEKKMKSSWQTVTIGSVTGLIFGAAATVFANGLGDDGQNSSASVNHNDPVNPSNNQTNGHQNAVGDNPLIVDDNIPTATCVDERMNFSEAFAAARAEVGSGGVFEWHGNLYNTYTAEEWNAMSAEQKADYSEHFAWAHQESHDLAQNEHSSIREGDTIEAEVVTHDNHVGDGAVLSDNEENTAEQVEMIDADDVQIEVLGVVHDNDSSMNYGTISIDGKEAVVVDVDGDMVFDRLVIDVDSNGEIVESEVSDISGENLTVDAMGGFTDPGTGNMMVSTDESNYMEDGDYEI